jgi:hypoxanthine phosphoribosyltransferase
MNDKVSLEFSEISRRLHALVLPVFDVVVGIARGGLLPASLVAHQLELPLFLMQFNYRDDDNKPRRTVPELLKPLEFDPSGQRVLLVDDVSVSGATFNVARELLSGASITTLACKGKADFVLFPEVAACVNWPWSLS